MAVRIARHDEQQVGQAIEVLGRQRVDSTVWLVTIFFDRSPGRSLCPPRHRGRYVKLGGNERAAWQDERRQLGQLLIE